MQSRFVALESDPLARIVLRADASPEIGLGHVMRTLAIAEAARARGVSALCVFGGGKEVAALATRQGHAVHPAGSDWIEVVEAGDVVVLDGYQFGPSDVGAVRRRGAIAALIDDTAESGTDADLVIAIDAGTDARAAVSSDGLVLAGFDYALIRAEFTERRRLRGAASEVLLVSFGGTDASGVGAALVAALARRGVPGPFLRVQVLVGPSTAMDTSTLPRWIEIVRDPASVGELFDQCSAAVTAAGTTALELLCMGIPCAAVVVAPNQVQAAAQIQQAGAALVFNDPGALIEQLDAVLPALVGVESCALSERALALIDGGGADRVVEALASFASQRSA